MNKPKRKKMREINPIHKKVYRLEVFTSHPMTEEAFISIVSQKLLKAEIELNKSFYLRFHIHEANEEK